MSRSVHTAIGEYLVLAELLKRDHEVYLAHGPTQTEWDIVKCTANGVKRIQVKTISWPKRRTVNLNPVTEYDYLVIVLLNKPTTPNEIRNSFFLIIPADQIAPLLSPYNAKRQNKQRTIYISSILSDIQTSNLGIHLNNWNCILTE
ncbi:hypothetical protein [Brevibacillus sp. MS2.2]|uniref:hypothetical protein n=1 Tax=Brevibacillus sp. MS2.2 TaxID=2738981 RepID=UPI00156BC891|nr:hypothetical protein [Brevibacillus sp. MS2.2]NRR19746.1 hypothetical protein [Brevibacillus sp. MS2.2]